MQQYQREKIDKMSDEVKDSNPYSRLMALQRMGVVENYNDIKNYSLIIVGVGGVGSVAAEMLCRCGIGKLILYDYDKVELANMNRLFYRPEHSGKMKVDAARETLLQINPDVIIEAYSYNITSNDHYGKFLEKIKTGGLNNTNVSLILSCVDNYAARMTINKACNSLNQLWMESGVSEDAMNGHIQFIIPGETACFACAPPLVVAEDGNEKKIKREGVCAASLPTTMAIIAGFLSQNTLKYLLNFGETSYFLSYNSFKDFFPNSILLPNPGCNDDNCVELQNKFNQGINHSRKNAKIEKKVEIASTFENDWGITMETEVLEKVEEKPVVKTVDTSNQSLDDLKNQMKNLMKKK